MKELPNRFSCVNSEGVVSKRAAIDVSVSRSLTAYDIVGTGVIEPTHDGKKILFPTLKNHVLLSYL